MWRHFEAEAWLAETCATGIDEADALLRQCRLNELAIEAITRGEHWLALHLLGQPVACVSWRPSADPGGLRVGRTASGGAVIVDRAGEDRRFDGHVIAAIAVHHVPLREHKTVDQLCDQAETVAGLIELISANMQIMRS